jgi:hypothetical protein
MRTSRAKEEIRAFSSNSDWQATCNIWHVKQHRGGYVQDHAKHGSVLQLPRSFADGRDQPSRSQAEGGSGSTEQVQGIRLGGDYVSRAKTKY